MSTARELLEQAEALMQRERAALMSDDIPTLTDSVPTPHGGVVGGPALDGRHSPASLDDIPMLTEAVEDFDTPSIPLAQSLDDELAMWRETEAESVHVSTPAASIATDAQPLQQAAPEPPEKMQRRREKRRWNPDRARPNLGSMWWKVVRGAGAPPSGGPWPCSSA